MEPRRYQLFKKRTLLLGTCKLNFQKIKKIDKNDTIRCKCSVVYYYNFYIDNYTVRQCSSRLCREISLTLAFGRQCYDFREQPLWPGPFGLVFSCQPAKDTCEPSAGLWVNWGSLMPLRCNPLRLEGHLPPWFLVLVQSCWTR